MGVVLADLVANLRGFRPTAVPVDGRRAAAVAITIYGRGDTLGIWLTRRATRLRAHAGQFALPGGRLDDGEDAVAGALRELGEELGLVADGSVGSDGSVGLLDDYPTRSGYVITPVVIVTGDGVPRPNPAEVAEVHAIPLSDVDVEPTFLTIPESDRPVIQVPLVGQMVHAPTAAILHQFREVALHGRHTRVADYEQPVFAWT